MYGRLLTHIKNTSYLTLANKKLWAWASTFKTLRIKSYSVLPRSFIIIIKRKRKRREGEKSDKSTFPVSNSSLLFALQRATAHVPLPTIPSSNGDTTSSLSLFGERVTPQAPDWAKCLRMLRWACRRWDFQAPDVTGHHPAALQCWFIPAVAPCHGPQDDPNPGQEASEWPGPKHLPKSVWDTASPQCS